MNEYQNAGENSAFLRYEPYRGYLKRRDIQRYQKQQFAHVLLHSYS